MAKFKALKKIAALATAIALVVCFAVSASAVDILTTTTYVGNDENNVDVTVTVTGIDEGVNVTYYAYDGSNPVHIDQEKATATGAEFNFRTATTNLESAVKVGYTNGTATDSQIDGYVVTYPDGSKIIPTEATTVSFPYSLPSGEVFSEAFVTAGTATIAASQYAGGNVIVTFSAISSDATIAVATVDAPPTVSTAVVEYVESAAVLVKAATGADADWYNEKYGFKVDGVVDENNNSSYNEDANASNLGDRKITVIGKANSCEEYGVIVSTAAITSGDYTSIDALGDAYAGALNDDEGVFAVQLIDVSNGENGGEAFIVEGTTYYTAIYAKDNNNLYKVVAGGSVVAQ